jgi:hypothetical protein
VSLRLFIARPLPGTVGETLRLAHLFRVPEDETPPRLNALCGEDFGPDELELLEYPLGMPCEACLRNTPPLNELLEDT